MQRCTRARRTVSRLRFIRIFHVARNVLAQLVREGRILAGRVRGGGRCPLAVLALVVVGGQDQRRRLVHVRLTGQRILRALPPRAPTTKKKARHGLAACRGGRAGGRGARDTDPYIAHVAKDGRGLFERLAAGGDEVDTDERETASEAEEDNLRTREQEKEGRPRKRREAEENKEGREGTVWRERQRPSFPLVSRRARARTSRAAMHSKSP